MTGAPLNIALIGSGFMGRAHTLAFAAADRTFDLPRSPRVTILADRDLGTATAAAASLGIARASGDWRETIADASIDMVAIATPNLLHAPIAIAALEAGKAVYCEKPLATTIAESEAMTAAAAASGLPTAVGFTYLYNPMIVLARELIAGGEIGEVTAFRGIHAEDFMASADAPFNWRCEPDQAGGALADIGSHIIAMARHLVGDIAAVSGRLHTAYPMRRDARGADRAVTVDDQMDAVVEFANGATGTLAASWIASGHKMGLAFEVSGTRGSIAFTQERFSELRLYRSGPGRTNGFTTICAGPEHGDYGAFCPAPGHQIGYNDLKTIEVKAVVEAAAGLPSAAMSFADALAVERVTDAIRRSHREGCWIGLQAAWAGASAASISS
ncbi:Gfo/Idh/MocA family protein [Sphingopyxis panaciterrulae]|uniref:Putative dehydrogenase n=1 Tax=Sphingopyxis panaciterrulae TaxID=462372 RepID=A0A7W9ET55_9SPHN|nr:Gfo/Idh/MocA family oxidoreductase [Sphingopyxis panaciterrulae]MBB5707626.1 putative dehydrogenase [Sphingopyxis panaciterrulae]